MEILQLLKNLGLTDNEPDVYLTLIKMPGAQPASIIAQKLKMNRTTTYKILINLSKVGLVTKTMRHGITCFLAEKADKQIENLFFEKKEKLNKVNQQLIDMLPVIKNLQKYELLTPKVRFYEGIEGVKRVYEDTLIAKETIYAFENVEPMMPDLKDYIFNDYIPRRAENNIFVKVITPENKDHKSVRKDDKKFLRETRFFSQDILPIEIEINIYGGKTALFSYKNEEMFAVIIESQAIANSMRSIFDFCWKFSK